MSNRQFYDQDKEPKKGQKHRPEPPHSAPRRAAPQQGQRPAEHRPTGHPPVQRSNRRAKKQQLARRRALLLLVVLIALCFAAWGIVELMTKDKKPADSTAPSSAASSQISSAASSTPQETPAPTPEATPSATPEPTKAPATTEQDWKMRLVNANNPLPEGFEPELATLANGKQFDARAIDSLNAMLADAKAAGLSPLVCSAYRSIARQDELFNQMKQDYMAKGMTEAEAYAKTATIRTPHGCSEHSSGLAADIVAVDYQRLDDGYENTPEAQWLHAHAAEYGFILRYPKGKEAVTGIIAEPWHFRYVGVENAQKIKDSGLCLEEYLEQNG